MARNMSMISSETISPAQATQIESDLYALKTFTQADIVVPASVVVDQPNKKVDLQTINGPLGIICERPKRTITGVLGGRITACTIT